MDANLAGANFPAWLIATHWLNVLFITILMRSGVQILFDLPKLYWNDNCPIGSEWLKFTKREMPEDKLWTSHEEAEPVSSLIALPGGYRTSGNARAWHFFTVIFWVLNGLFYVTCLFATGASRRLIPTDPEIFLKAFHTFVSYLSLQLPPASAYQPYDPLQQLVYAFVVFVMAPLAILTGAFQSPAVGARFPKILSLLGGRQAVRSVHFIIMASYVAFLIVHVSLVIITGFATNMNHMVLGIESKSKMGIFLGLVIISLIVLVHIAATWFSHAHPRRVQNTFGAFAQFFIGLFLNPLASCQNYAPSDISPYFRVNGYPPETKEWFKLKENHYRDYRLTVRGLVENPLSLSLEDLKSLGEQSQITKHHCVQGWTAVAEWTGVPLSVILELAKPLAEAKYLVFYSFQYDKEGDQFYGTITTDDAMHKQTLLAYEMNKKPLPTEYGAPLRLRAESYVGYKMTKWIKEIEVVSDYAHIFRGQGGYREDKEFQLRVPKA